MQFVKPSLLFGMMFSVSLMAAEGCSDMGKNTDYVQPSTEVLWGAEQLFHSLLSRPLRDDWQDQLAASGLQLCETAGELDRESEGSRGQGEIKLDGADQGWGYYQFAPQVRSNLLIQAPHQFYDSDTGVIARQFFAEHRFLALALNSSNRNSASNVQTADLAHLPRSHFTALARAAVLANPKAVLLQFHGFAKAKRKQENQKFDLIISNGTARSSEALYQLAQCAQSNVGLETAVYPDQVDELGATTNSVGKAMRTINSRGFLHIEMSRSARRLLRGDPVVRTKLYGCLSSYAL